MRFTLTDFIIGGISFFSRRYRWAADNVRNFEVGVVYIVDLKLTSI